MKYAATAMASATMVALTNAHGFITKPAARMPGDAMQEACGMQVYYNQEGDNYGNVQGELQVASSQDDYNAKACNIWMCKGYKYADNKDNVQKWTVGQTVPITVDIRAPHTGTANVSIVETATNTMVGSMLKHWDVYASTATTIPEGQKQFDITIPELNGKCTEAGACVLQWWWDARSIDQTYESCVDFTVSGGSGSKVAVTTAEQVAASTSVSVASSTTEAPVASTCACSVSKRDALPQQAYGSDSSCSAETTTVTQTKTAETVTVTQTATATVTGTITLHPSSSVAAAETASLSAPTSVAAIATGVSASSSKCTTSITLTRGASAGVSSVADAVTGAPYPYPTANVTVAPTASAPSVSLAPVYSSALANITSSLAAAAMTSVVPSASVNPLISSYLANITSVLPTGALPVGTAAPTALPSGYITVTSAPQATSPPSYGGSDEAPAQGMTLKQIFEWIAYLMKQVFQDGEKKGEAEAAAPAPSKRSHARSFMG